MSDAEFSGMLDLTGADESAGSFDAIPSGKYNGHIHEAEWRFTKGGPDSKMPEGTPYLNVQIAIDDDEKNGVKVNNRRVFGKLFVPPSGHDAKASATMKGAMLNFLRAAGYSDEQINKKGFRLDPDDLAGREIVVSVSRFKNDYTEDWDNSIRGYKPAGTAGDRSETAGSLI